MADKLRHCRVQTEKGDGSTSESSGCRVSEGVGPSDGRHGKANDSRKRGDQRTVVEDIGQDGAADREQRQLEGTRTAPAAGDRTSPVIGNSADREESCQSKGIRDRTVSVILLRLSPHFCYVQAPSENSLPFYISHLTFQSCHLWFRCDLTLCEMFVLLSHCFHSLLCDFSPPVFGSLFHCRYSVITSIRICLLYVLVHQINRLYMYAVLDTTLKILKIVNENIQIQLCSLVIIVILLLLFCAILLMQWCGVMWMWCGGVIDDSDVAWEMSDTAAVVGRSRLGHW